MPRNLQLLLATLVVLGLAASAAQAERGGSSVDRTLARNPTIGMEGTYFLNAGGPTLAAAPVTDAAPLVLRIASVTPATDSPNGDNVYELRYLATRADQYDLRDYLVREDGRPLGEINPIPVVIKGLLPADDAGALRALPPTPVPWYWPYRLLLAMGAVVWLIPLARWWSSRKRTQRPPAALATTAGPSLFDQLQPFVTAAMEGTLSSEGQAQLELLLYSHWRERFGLADGSPLAIRDAMRDNPEAARLLDHLDRWLYQPGRGVDVEALLAPYRAAPRIEAAANRHEKEPA